MFETSMFLELMEKFCTKAHKNSKGKGFWDDANGPDNTSYPVKYLLIISEIAELFEAYRKGILLKPCDKDATIIDPLSKEPVGFRRLTNEEEEIADVVIRIGDYCGYRNLDLGRIILAKMSYNESRLHMHGKNC